MKTFDIPFRLPFSSPREKFVATFQNRAVPFLFKRHVQQVVDPVKIMFPALNQQLLMKVCQFGIFEPVFIF